MRRSASFVSALAIALWVSSVWASPIADGTIGTGEYSYPPLVDASEPAADFYNSGLDIDKVYFDDDGSSRFMGLTVVAPPFDVNGSPSSFAQTTGVALYFYDNQTDVMPKVYMALNFTAGGFQDDLSFIREWNGSSWEQTLFADLTAGPTDDYEVGTASAMEISICRDVFEVYDGDVWPGYLRLQLDDTGFQQDDQLEGMIPEPATAVILLIGAGGILLRRRR